jgi:4-diphosphocytidyl-2-C-methyl-D-erythritol kinase
VILALPARAKLNLTLRVTGSLPDGRHALATRFQALDLHDLLELEPAAQTSLRVDGQAPTDEDNLVLKALRALETVAGRALPTAIRLHKRIPAGAGLGGGSSDAAAALRGLSAVHRLDIDLGPVGRGLGADVCFFLRGGAADATGAGDELAGAPRARGWFAIAWPGFGASTRAVYEAFDRIGPGDGPNQLEAAALEVEPRLRPFRDQLGPGWQLTGSGSAYFRPAPTRQEALEAIQGVAAWTCVTRPVGAWA